MEKKGADLVQGLDLDQGLVIVENQVAEKETEIAQKQTNHTGDSKISIATSLMF